MSVYFQGSVRCSASVYFHGLLPEVCTIIWLAVNRHLVSGHEIDRLQHGLQLIMARYTRIINCWPRCNVHLMHRKVHRSAVYNSVRQCHNAAGVTCCTHSTLRRTQRVAHLCEFSAPSPRTTAAPTLCVYSTDTPRAFTRNILTEANVTPQSLPQTAQGGDPAHPAPPTVSTCTC